jgi:hypothetical protein
MNIRPYLFFVFILFGCETVKEKPFVIRNTQAVIDRQTFLDTTKMENFAFFIKEDSSYKIGDTLRGKFFFAKNTLYQPQTVPIKMNFAEYIRENGQLKEKRRKESIPVYNDTGYVSLPVTKNLMEPEGIEGLMLEITISLPQKDTSFLFSEILKYKK